MYGADRAGTGRIPVGFFFSIAKNNHFTAAMCYECNSLVVLDRLTGLGPSAMA
jgi:hypothetical protein